jgi:hypothetical protein
MNQSAPLDSTLTPSLSSGEPSPGLRVPVTALPGSPREQRRIATARAKGSPLPPVPLSVWLSVPLTGCCRRCEEPTSAACANRLPLALARQAIDAFSRPGDIVFVPDAGNATTLIAAVMGRRKVLGLVRGSDQGRRTQQRREVAGGDRVVRSQDREGSALGDASALGGGVAGVGGVADDRQAGHLGGLVGQALLGAAALVAAAHQSQPR